jgi:zinc transporter 9|tara:strand:+ start:54 stop:824 length:771 start_codon:yes stop_codon:yes gene_type:complete
MDPQTLIFAFAGIMFIAVAAFGYVPLTLELSSDRLKQLTAIGAGVLIGSAFLVIIPEALEIFEGHEEVHIEPSTIGLAILGGFVLMLLLEVFGLPHAVHHDEDKDLLGLSATIGLLVHALVDGLAVGASVSSSNETGLIVFVAIMLHKGPAAFGLTSFLKHIKISESKSKWYLFAFALASPIMAILAFFVLRDTSFATVDNIGLALLFSAGTFIYVATVDVLPEVHSHDHNHDPPVWFVILGIIFVFLITLMGHNH